MNPPYSAPNIEHTSFAPVVEAFSKNGDATLGGRFGSVSLKSNGKTFAMLVKGRFVIKLPRERVAEMVAAGDAGHFDPGHSRLMKEWVTLAGQEHRWVDLAHEVYAYVTAPARRGRKPSR